MLDLAAIQPTLGRRIAEELALVGGIFEEQLASDLSAVNELCDHVSRFRGKMLRPTLVMVAAAAARGDDGSAIDQPHRMLAATVEMIHMATLVHDDVLDEADVRRRGATVNRLWGNEAAVMLGDYLISNAFHLCSRIGDPDVNLALGRVTNTLCAGELLQLHHRGDQGLDVPTYLEIVRRKTASLIAESCRLGGVLAGADDAVAATLHEIGVQLGIAFQVQDDLLDLMGELDVIGKPAGQDLAKGKMTLPIILHLESAAAAERSQVLDLLDRGDRRGLGAVLAEHGAIEAARKQAEGFVDVAVDAIERLPAGPARDLLRVLARRIVERDH
ncbi:MAG: polyprenyl synthetase family protein [Phycisphaerales bacterium]